MATLNDMARYRLGGSARRIVGLVLVIGLHLLFFAVLVAQRGAVLAPLGRVDAGAIVWIAPTVPRLTASSPALATRRDVRPKTPALSVPQAPAMHMIATEPLPARPPSTAPTGDVLSAETGTLEKTAPARDDLSGLDQRTIGAAIKATLAENPVIAPRKGLIRVRELGRFEQFGADVQEASVPDCDKPDALKLDPPVIPGTRVALKGLLVLPHLAHAALTGRCR